MNVVFTFVLILLAFVLSNYGVLAVTRRKVQNGSDAGALAAADYLADELTRQDFYGYRCPVDLYDWRDNIEKLEEQYAWELYRSDVYERSLVTREDLWFREVDTYLGAHESGRASTPLLTDYGYPVEGRKLREWIEVAVFGNASSPVTSPQYVGTSAVPVQARAAARFSSEDPVFLHEICPTVSRTFYFGYDTDNSYVRNQCADEEFYWEDLGAEGTCSIRVKNPICMRRVCFPGPEGRPPRCFCLRWTPWEYLYILDVSVTPERYGFDFAWESNGLRPAPAP